MAKVVLITGASSGIGYATAKIISKAVNAKKPKVRYRYGMGKMMVFMSKFMPARFFDWMMRYMYESGLIK